MYVTTTAATAILLLCRAASAVNADEHSQCSDKNKLNGVSVDARLIAIEFYYQGLIDSPADGRRKSCLSGRFLSDGKLALVNKTLELIERDCLPISQAARIAADGECP
jgi:hypothetical protein